MHFIHNNNVNTLFSNLEIPGFGLSLSVNDNPELFDLRFAHHCAKTRVYRIFNDNVNKRSSTKFFYLNIIGLGLEFDDSFRCCLHW